MCRCVDDSISQSRCMLCDEVLSDGIFEAASKETDNEVLVFV